MRATKKYVVLDKQDRILNQSNNGELADRKARYLVEKEITDAAFVLKKKK